MIIVLLFAVIFGILLISELLWRGKFLRGEAGRKFVHITVGAFVASWPLFVDMRTIVPMSVALLAVVYVSKRYLVFHGVHGVRRKTWGELMFPIGIGAAALLSPSPWVFSVAILHLSVADGLAAVFGERYGKGNRYKVFGETRSVIGTMVFYLVSLAIAGGVVLLKPSMFSQAAVPVLFALPAIATTVENLSPRGTDNVTVPLLVVACLRLI